MSEAGARPLEMLQLHCPQCLSNIDLLYGYRVGDFGAHDRARWVKEIREPRLLGCACGWSAVSVIVKEVD